MARIFTGNRSDAATFLGELPNHYIIGGHLYKKQGLTPVPGGIIDIPGQNTEGPRNGFMMNRAAGRAPYMDPFCEVGSLVTASIWSDKPTLYGMYQPSEGANSAYLLDTTSPVYCYFFGTGNYYPRKLLVTPASDTIGVTAADPVETDLELCVCYKVDLQSNTIVWKSSPGSFSGDTYIFMQDADFLYFIGKYRTPNKQISHNVSIGQYNGSVIGKISKQTGAVSILGGTEGSLSYALEYGANSTNIPSYAGARFLGVDGTKVWFCSIAQYATSCNVMVYGYFDLGTNKWYVSSPSQYNIVYSQTGATNTCLIAISVTKPIVIAGSTYTYFSIMDAPAATVLEFSRRKLLTYPVNTTDYPYYVQGSSNKFTVPVPPFCIGTYAQGVSKTGMGNLVALERTNGDTTKTRFLLLTFQHTPSCAANDDVASPNYLIKCTAEADATSTSSNTAVLVSTFYDANYGIVWVDDLTFITVGQKRVRLYKINLTDETVSLLNTFTVSSSGNEIAYAAVDSAKNIWYVEWNPLNKSSYQVYFETQYVVSQVEVKFQLQSANYTGTDIASNLTASAKNSLGEYIACNIELIMQGPAKFTANNSDKITVAVTTSGALTVPITITGAGYINCTGKVVA